MCELNQTQVTHIKLLGFHGLHEYKIAFFLVFLLTYMLILMGNLLIIILVSTVDHLKIPMFFFLKHVATSDVLLTTILVPVALDVIINDGGIIPLFGCITQLFCFTICSCFQNVLIAVMSYDRYLAICNPLQYPTLMNAHVFSQLIIGLWIVMIILLSSEMFLLFTFDYCGLDYIDNIFCDFRPLVELATSDVSSLLLQDFVISNLTISLPFTFIILTYIGILVTILKISSTYGRRKAFSTCSTHLALVCAYYGTLTIVYVVPSSGNSTNKYTSLLYTFVSPLLNPIIYSLRNHEIKRALQKTLTNLKTYLKYRQRNKH